MILLAAAVCLAACIGATSPAAPAPQPTIELQPRGNTWTSEPIRDELDDVSHEGAAYTGDIDVYEITMPSPGRLQVSLSWEHDADYDLFITADREATMRLAEGVQNDAEPEYVGLDVAGGQTIYILVAGWEGEPGPYVLETILLPPGEPIFAIESGPDLDSAWPGNEPLVFRFNKDIDPSQAFTERILFLAPGRLARGNWCIEGAQLVFYPELHELPGAEPGLLPGEDYTLQFPPAARGVRAVTGEYLTGLVGATFEIAPLLDMLPGQPPRVASILPDPSLPYGGAAITIALSEPIDPDTFFPELHQVAPDGTELPLAFTTRLTQQTLCSGRSEVRVTIAPSGVPTSGAVTRLRLPGTILGISGEPTAGNALEGGTGYEVDFQSP